MRYIARASVLIVLAAAGAAAAAALTGPSTGTVAVCASVPAQTIAANGVPVGTVPATSNCVTSTYTVSTVTTTVSSSSATSTAPTTTALVKPSIPSGLTVTVGDGSLSLAWNPNPASEQVDEYQVYLQDQNYDLHVKATSYTVTGLTNGLTYRVRVSAHNAAGYGDWTTAIPAVPAATTTTTATTTTSPTPDTGTTDFSLGWESGDNTGFTGLECPNPATQFAVQRTVVREGSYAAMFHQETGDVWSNGSTRCLDTIYNSGEVTGMDKWFGLSVYLATSIDTSLIWELHQQNQYFAPTCLVAPYALVVRNGWVQFRIKTGDCTSGAPSYNEPNIVIPRFNPYPKSVWMDFVFHIRFAEDNAGVVQVWAKRKGEQWSATPDIERTGIPTALYDSDTHNMPLYGELGIYSNYSPFSGSETVYLDGYKRGPSFAAVAPS